jgi:hypothetical protein
MSWTSALKRDKATDIPFECHVLHITMLIIQSLEQAFCKLCRCTAVMSEEGGILVGQEPVEVVQRHVSEVGIGVIELRQQRENSRLSYLPVRHDEVGAKIEGVEKF